MTLYPNLLDPLGNVNFAVGVTGQNRPVLQMVAEQAAAVGEQRKADIQMNAISKCKAFPVVGNETISAVTRLEGYSTPQNWIMYLQLSLPPMQLKLI